MGRLDWELIGIVVVGVLAAVSVGCGLISVILTLMAYGAW